VVCGNPLKSRLISSTHCRTCWLQRVRIPDHQVSPTTVEPILDTPSKTTEAERAYAAGIVDGEGHIGFTSWKGNWLPVVVVTNTDPLLSEWLRDRFGGAIHWHGRRLAQHRDRYNWRLQGRHAMTFLQEIGTHLLLKRAQATLIREYYLNGGDFHWGNRPLPEAERQRRADLHVRMKALNARGPRAEPDTET
jgi:hypothetical protein